MTISIESLVLFFLSLVGLFSPLAGLASMANITEIALESGIKFLQLLGN